MVYVALYNVTSERVSMHMEGGEKLRPQEVMIGKDVDKEGVAEKDRKIVKQNR